MNILISADQEKFVESLVASGSFSDPSEVVNKALEMFKRHEELRKEIQIGIDQLDRGEAAKYGKHSFHQFREDILGAEKKLFREDNW